MPCLTTTIHICISTYICNMYTHIIAPRRHKTCQALIQPWLIPRKRPEKVLHPVHADLCRQRGQTSADNIRARTAQTENRLKLDIHETLDLLRPPKHPKQRPLSQHEGNMGHDFGYFGDPGLCTRAFRTIFRSSEQSGRNKSRCQVAVSNIGGPFCGRPCNQSPAILGLYQGP